MKAFTFSVSLSCLAFLPFTQLSAQCPVGNVTLSSQAQVDAFAANFPTCNTILGNLTIIGSGLSPSDITDLSPLDQIVHVSGSVRIISNSLLTDLSGLDNLQTIGKDLFIQFNPVLSNLDGLAQLDTIREAIYILQNLSLASIHGLSNLDYVYEFGLAANPNVSSLTGLEQTFVDSIISIVGNYNLTGLDGLGSLEDFSGSLDIYNNPNIQDFSILSGLDSLDRLQLGRCNYLTNLQILDNLVFVEEFLSFDANPALISLEGLANLKQLGGLGITNNPLLTSLSGLAPIKEMKGNVYFTNNALQSLEGMDSLVTVGGYMLVFQENMTDLSGLKNLTSVGQSFWLHGNGSLNNLDGLERLQYVGTELSIENNHALTSLEGLNHSIMPVNHAIYINNNSTLGACAVRAVCETLQMSWDSVRISTSNAAGCQDRVEVLQACLTPLSPEPESLPVCVVSPNPFTDVIQIKADIQSEAVLRLRDLNGSALLKQAFTQQCQLDLHDLTPGLYVIEINLGHQVIVQRIVKM